jgi:hypothetical protein
MLPGLDASSRSDNLADAPAIRACLLPRMQATRDGNQIAARPKGKTHLATCQKRFHLLCGEIYNVELRPRETVNCRMNRL